ncbi:MAG: hypothetical protein ACLR8X_00950 [Gallintestinimicrobium sp.]
MENDSGQVITEKKYLVFCHENPLCPFQHILHHFLTEQAAFSILMTLEKKTQLPHFAAERRIL